MPRAVGGRRLPRSACPAAAVARCDRRLLCTRCPPTQGTDDPLCMAGEPETATAPSTGRRRASGRSGGHERATGRGHRERLGKIERVVACRTGHGRCSLLERRGQHCSELAFGQRGQCGDQIVSGMHARCFASCFWVPFGRGSRPAEPDRRPGSGSCLTGQHQVAAGDGGADRSRRDCRLAVASPAAAWPPLASAGSA